MSLGWGLEEVGSSDWEWGKWGGGGMGLGVGMGFVVRARGVVFGKGAGMQAQEGIFRYGLPPMWLL